MNPAMALFERVESAKARIAVAAQRSGRSAAAVTLVAVTKTLPASVVAEAHALGLTIFGENRVQEGAAKRAELALPNTRWELIGHLQTNKVAAALATFDRIESVDSLHLAQSLSARAMPLGRDIPVLLEVNVAGEESKTGFSPEAVLAAASQIVALPHLRVEGLMTVAPIAERPDDVRPIFARLRALRDHLRTEVPSGPGGGWPELSMGMSDDFEVAIEEGATIVRLGRAIFGERPPVSARYTVADGERGR